MWLMHRTQFLSLCCICRLLFNWPLHHHWQHTHTHPCVPLERRMLCKSSRNSTIRQMVGRTTQLINIGQHLHASSSSSSSNYNVLKMRASHYQQPTGAFHPTGDQMKTKVLQVVAQLLLLRLLLLLLMLLLPMLLLLKFIYCLGLVAVCFLYLQVYVCCSHVAAAAVAVLHWVLCRCCH